MCAYTHMTSEWKHSCFHTLVPGEGITPVPLATSSLIAVANIPDRDYEKDRLAGVEEDL